MKLLYFSYYGIIVFLFMVVPVLLKDYYSAFLVGLIISILSLTKPLSMWINKRFEITKKIVLYINTVLIVSLFGIVFFIDNIYIVLFFSILFGWSNNFILSYFDQIKLQTYRKYLGKFRVYGSIGGAFLFTLLSFNLIQKEFYIYLFLFFLVLYIYSSYNILIKRKLVKIKQIKSSPLNFRFLSKNYGLWINTALITVSFAFFHSFFVIYLNQFSDLNNQQIYSLLLIGIIAEIIALNYAHIFLKKFSSEFIFKFVFLISFVRLFLFNYYSDNYLMLVFVQSLHFFTMGLFFPAFLDIVRGEYKKNINFVLQTYNGVIHGLLSGVSILVLSYFYFEFIFYIISFIMMLSYLYFYVLPKK